MQSKLFIKLSHSMAIHPWGGRLIPGVRSLILITCAIIALFFFCLSRLLLPDRHHVAVPDEKAAGEAVLARKFAGPGYFHVPAPETEGSLLPTARPAVPYWISDASAKSQVERIAKERNLGPDGVAKLNSLIARLSRAAKRSSKVRLAADEDVNVLQLNLALDEK